MDYALNRWAGARSRRRGAREPRPRGRLMCRAGEGLRRALRRAQATAMRPPPRSCRALAAWYSDKAFWAGLVERVMRQDWSWDDPAFGYVSLYYKAMKR
jgi:glycogen synthase